MGKYINLNREEINQRVEELIAQYAEHGIELKLNSNDIYDKRQYEIWYGGEIAAFEYRSRYFVSIRATGDVKADLNDENGETIIRVKDKQDNGRFYDEMQVYIPDDEKLDRYLGYDGKNWTGEARLIIWDNNWMEAKIYDNKEGIWLDAGCILIKSEGALDIGYKDVVGYVDCCIDQSRIEKIETEGRSQTMEKSTQYLRKKVSSVFWINTCYNEYRDKMSV